MKEFTTPLLVAPSSDQNATDLLMERLRTSPDHIAFETRSASGILTDPWRQVTTREFFTEVCAVAKGLIAAGVQPETTVAIMSPTRYEWAVMDMAVWFAGAIVVPIYETSAALQVAAILEDAGVVFAITDSADRASVLRQGFAQAEMTPTHIWTMNPEDEPNLLDLANLGKQVLDEVLEERRVLAKLNSIASIVYTSGTTSAPKGACITHGNFVGQVLNVAAAYTEVVKETGNTVIFLPMAHVLARGLQLACLANGMRIAHLSDTQEVVPALGKLKPTFLVVVPRVLEKIRASAGSSAAEKHLGRIWQWAQNTAIEWGRLEETRVENPTAKASASLQLRHAIFDRLFFKRLRTLVGGRLEYLLSGAAALDGELLLFFQGLGLPVIEGYGLTETTAPLTGNMPGSFKAGSVGVPMPGTTIRISDQGEVLSRGVGVFLGYKRADDNKEAFTDGFFHTGDLGELDELGRLTLSGRIKDVIVTSGGKTVSPSIWEAYIEADPLIAYAAMVGDGRSYLSALVLLNPLELAQWAEKQGITDLRDPVISEAGQLVEVSDSHLVTAIKKTVATANAKVASSEQVKKFVLLLTELGDTSELLTPTLKLKRNVLVSRATQMIENLYASPTR